MPEIIFAFIAILQFITAANMTFHFVISFFAWHSKKEKEKKGADCSFAVIIAAHNEEKVISDTLKSLKESNYPKNLYDIFVVADNCSDSTAVLSKNEGATVWERNDSLHKGKGYALSWAFQKLFSQKKQYDAVVIADADNIVDKNFLAELSLSFGCGCKAVQGYIKAKNPYSSWVSASYHITHLCLNKLYQKARHNIGFPVQLNGTGFALKTELIKNISWDPSCLTEDMELTVKMALSGIYASYNENAVIYDEKPIDFMTSYNQRVRWMQGQSDVFSRYILPLLKNKNKINPLKTIDCAAYLMQPYIFVLTGILTLLTVVQYIIPVQFMYIPFKGTFMAAVLTVIQFLSIPLYLLIINRLNLKTLKYYIPYLIFVYSWIPVSFMGILNRKKKEWFHTKHTVCISNE